MGAVGRQWPQIEGLAKARIGSFRFHLTTGPGDATRLARQALLRGAEVIVCVGGDGTLNEVINGLMDGHGPVEPRVRLGLIPNGTGCDLVKTVPIPKEINGALDLILEGHVLPIDLGRVTYRERRGRTACRYFHNVTSIGLGGEVADRVNRTTRALGGFLSFLWATLISLLLYDKKRVRLKVDDGLEETAVAWTIAVANGQFQGGGMWIAPGARIADGLFHVTVVGDLGLPEVFRNLPKLYNGKILEVEKVSSFSARKIEVDSDQRVLLEVDGEQPGQLPATIEMAPAALNLITPVHFSP